MSDVRLTGQIQIPDGDAVSSLPAGSIQRLLDANLGKEVVAEFVVGADEAVRKAGTLYAVNTDYMVLYDDVNLVDVACDLYSLKFISFYLPGTRPDLSRVGNGTNSAPSGNNSGRSSAPEVKSSGEDSSGSNDGNKSGGAKGTSAGNSSGSSAVILAARKPSQAAFNYTKRKIRN